MSHIAYRVPRWFPLLIAGAATLVAAPPAHAHKRDFGFTYEWWTPARGEKEIESYSTYGTRSKNYDGAIEFETGLTDKFSGSLYYLYSKDNGDSLKTEGYAIESRYRFGEFATNKILPAAYLEYEKEKGATAEGEVKGIFSYYLDDPAMTDISLNLVAGRGLKSGAETEYGYTLGYARQSGPNTRYGLEATGSLQENSHALGPVVAYDINPSTRAVLSTNFALTNKADTRIRLLVEYEWF